MHTLDKYYAQDEKWRGEIELRAALNKIDRMLCNPRIGKDLSAILGATRGPDDENDDVKENTTAHIRRAAFPLAFAQKFVGKTTGWSAMISSTFREEMAWNSSGHFASHIKWAARALGLLQR